jgi:glycoprotein-N-acetylgalactosamine 3-beta-galactosyltransferase
MLTGILTVSVAFFLLVVQTVIPTLPGEIGWLPRPTGTFRAGDQPTHRGHIEQLRPHPNGKAVAYDEHGNPGYVHDPYYVKNNPLNFTFLADGHEICKEPVGHGQERRRGSYALRKIVVMPAQPSPRILCMVYSYSERHDVVRAIAETYGPRCDGFLAASNQTDRSIGAVRLDHAGPESYRNMWQKVRSMWIYVYQHYLDDFEFFHIGGDNMFVIAENLRYAASLEDPTKPVYMGAAMTDFGAPRRRYCGGGAGYTLSREALRRMVSEEFNYSRCHPTNERSDEDKMVGTCLRLKVATCKQNNDEKEEPRYHHYDPEFHARWDRGMGSNWGWRDLLKYHQIIAYQQRLETVSVTSATFHLTAKSMYRDQGLRRYHALLYGLCGDGLKLEPLVELNFTCNSSSCDED